MEALIRANFVFVASFAPTQALVDTGGFRGFVSRHDAAPQPGDRGLAEDWDMWLRLAALGVPISIVEAPTLLYRVRDSSLASDEGSLLDAGIAMLCAFDAEQGGRHHHAVRASMRAMEQRRQLAHLQRELRRSGRRAAVTDVIPLMSRDWRTSLRALGLTVLTPERAERVLGRRGAW